MNRLNKTESAVFEYCRFSVFLKDPFFQIIYRSQQMSLLVGFVVLRAKSTAGRSVHLTTLFPGQA